MLRALLARRLPPAVYTGMNFLVVHEPSYSSEELLLGSDVADELGLAAEEFVEIRAASVTGPEPAVIDEELCR